MCHAMPFSTRALEKTFSLTLIFSGKKTNRMWFGVVCALVDGDAHHHGGQNVVDSPSSAS